MSLSWTASTDNVAVTGYNIYRNGVLVGTSPLAAYTNSSLAASTTYIYAVPLMTPPATCRPNPPRFKHHPGRPGHHTANGPSQLAVTATTYSSVSLSWTASTDNVAVTGYNVYRNGVLVGTSPVAAYTNGSLAASTTYIYSVAAYDAAGNFSTQSATVSATTPAAPDTTPPTVPANLAVTATTISSISLSWTASTDNVAVTGYNIYRGGIQIANRWFPRIPICRSCPPPCTPTQ